MVSHMRTYVESTASEREDMTETSTSSELGTTLKDGGLFLAHGNNGNVNGGAAAARAQPAVKEEEAAAAAVDEEVCLRVVFEWCVS